MGARSTEPEFEIDDLRCFVAPPQAPSREAAAREDVADERCFVRPEADPPLDTKAMTRVRRRGAYQRPEILTARECEIALLLAAQASNSEIARSLRISRRTVEHHVQSVLGRLSLRSRFQVTDALLGQQGCAPSNDTIGV